MPLKIAIIGAGPAGCMLARLLSHSEAARTIDVTIFESESSLDFRSQGGTLDLHEKTGQAALKAAGLFDQFLKYARYDGEAMNLCDKKLLSYIKQGASSKGSYTGRPEIDRPQLRQLLYESLPEGCVQWNHKLDHVGGEYPHFELNFKNQPSATGFDLIVGADGGWSRVRSLLSDVQPYYSGIAGHAFRIPDAEEREPELFGLVNRGSLFSFSDGKSIMAQYMSDGSLNIGTWAVKPQGWQSQGPFSSPGSISDTATVKAACKEEYADWDPRLVAFIEKAEDSISPRDLFMLPIGHSWPHKAGVTVIGDASHVMTPFAGEGVNLAFEDCLKLSQAIVRASYSEKDGTQTQELDKEIAAFEQDMFKRATETQQLTFDMMTAMYLTPGAPRTGIERYIIRAMEGQLGWWLTQLVKPLVYAWFSVFKLIW